MHENGRSVSKPKFPIAPSIPMWRPNQVHTFHIYLHLKLFLTQKLLQIYTANHATLPIQIRKSTVQIFGNFWVTQYLERGIIFEILLEKLAALSKICNMHSIVPYVQEVVTHFM